MVLKFKLMYYLSNIKLWFGLLILDIFTQLLQFTNKYLFSDITYLKFLCVACFLDLLTGITKVWATQGYRAVTSKGLRDTVIKFIQYGSFLIITHVLTHFEVNGEAFTTFAWLDKLAFEFLILIEIKSVYENIIAINPKFDFMKDVIKKIEAIIKPKKN